MQKNKKENCQNRMIQIANNSKCIVFMLIVLFNLLMYIPVFGQVSNQDSFEIQKKIVEYRYELEYVKFDSLSHFMH